MVWALTVQPSWTSSLLMLSPAALVPLGLGLACRPDAGPTTPVLDSLRLSAGPAALLAMAAFVLPLTVLTLVVVGRRAWVSHRAAPRR